MAYLQLDSVAKQYGGKMVLRDVSLALRAGEFVSLLGPSGCGKTTLLRIVAGFESPDAGTVLLEGKDITALAAAKRQMGMVFQAYSLFPNMTAAENVRFGLRVRRQDGQAQQKRAAELLDLVGLAEHAQKYPHQLSGGQQQRVALARALAIRPALLLLDEPLSALDAKVRVQLRDEIRRIQQETGVTTIFVTHDQEEALSISDRVVVMQQGVLSQVGDPAAIYGEPENIFVARFVGAVAELPGRVVDGGAGVVEVFGTNVRASRARGLAAGTKVHFLLRPESVRLSQPGADGGLTGVVAGRTFFGALTSLRIDLPGRGSLTAAMPSAEANGLALGTSVAVSWDEDAPRVLTEQGG
ncbi:MAG TPA: ABC transporter ATP-binding protein [Acetobacteraceae bacterium]|nr:ABC transporter ATP-binding protein [Acetobacteraceae bacterium]